MKNCAVGTITLLVLWSQVAMSAGRVGWVYEQITDPPASTAPESSRHQINLGVTHLEDSFSTQIQGTVDLDLVEVNLIAAQRAFLQSTVTGNQVAAELGSQERVFGIQLARFGISSTGYFGRFALGYLLPFPDTSAGRINVQLSMGFRAKEETPWSFLLGIRSYFAVNGEPHVVGADAENIRVFSLGQNQITAGGAFSWTYRIPVNPITTGSSEYMLISFGPVLGWNGFLGQFQLGARWRLWVDQNVTLNGSNQEVTNPLEVRAAPDFFFRWQATL